MIIVATPNERRMIIIDLHFFFKGIKCHIIIIIIKTVIELARKV